LDEGSIGCWQEGPIGAKQETFVSVGLPWRQTVAYQVPKSPDCEMCELAFMSVDVFASMRQLNIVVVRLLPYAWLS
jgi:hypothetical protein